MFLSFFVCLFILFLFWCNVLIHNLRTVSELKTLRRKRKRKNLNHWKPKMLRWKLLNENWKQENKKCWKKNTWGMFQKLDRSFLMLNISFSYMYNVFQKMSLSYRTMLDWCYFFQSIFVRNLNSLFYLEITVFNWVLHIFFNSLVSQAIWTF